MLLLKRTVNNFTSTIYFLSYVENDITMTEKPNTLFRRPLYGRRNGPSLGAGRRRLYEERLARFGLTPSGVLSTSLDPRDILDNSKCVWLEIGFGAGEHLAATALHNPDVLMIGCEHYMAGVASCLSKLDQQGVSNARVHRGDARDLMDAFPPASIERAYLLYPDPWPKTRHRKRRFINSETVSSFARIIAPQGELRIASDIPEYIAWSEEYLRKAPEFDAVHRSAEDTKTAWDGWTQTRYEAKALREGRTPAYLRYRRR